MSLKAVLAQIIAIIVAIVAMLFPSRDQNDGMLKPASDEAIAVIALYSDTHIDSSLPLGQINLAAGVADLNNAGDRPVDALIVAGDITNYGDIESLDAFYNALYQGKSVPSGRWIVAPGNHDIGHASAGYWNQADYTDEEKLVAVEDARKNFIDKYNQYVAAGGAEAIDQPYYAVEVNGYHFIVLADESGREGYDRNWDDMTMTDTQFDFLKSFLDSYADGEQPVFVISHWFPEGTNGNSHIYVDAGIEGDNNTGARLQALLEEYEKVVFIDGHAHSGLTTPETADAYGHYVVEEHDGVNYVNLPCYGLVNRAGYHLNGTGLIMEIYEDHILFQGRNYITGTYMPGCVYTIEWDPAPVSL